MNDWQRVTYAQAVKDAQRLLSEVGSEQTEPIDLVRVMAHLSLTISFGSFRSLSGAYLPGDSEVPPMIIVNAAHPFTRQRFTVGHEIGHHLEHEGVVYDEETEFLPRDATAPSAHEFYAEAFAASLLMPRRLVRHMMAELSIPEDRRPSAVEVYRLALRLRTSYAATVQQLRELGRITPADYQTLRHISPKRIKETITRGAAIGRHDVWLVQEPADGELIEVAPEDELLLELSEIPSSTYLWRLGLPHEAEQLASEFENPTAESELYGAKGTRRLRIRVPREPGTWPLRLELRSAVQKDLLDHRDVRLQVRPPWAAGVALGVGSHPAEEVEAVVA